AAANGTPVGTAPRVDRRCPSAPSQRASAPTRPSSAATATIANTVAVIFLVSPGKRPAGPDLRLGRPSASSDQNPSTRRRCIPMSSLALAHAAARGRISRRSIGQMLDQRGSDVLLAVATMALAAGLLAYIAGAFSVDTWLALVGGREVWQSGIPQHETLTALAHGKDWVDQQWLSELASFALF